MKCHFVYAVPTPRSYIFKFFWKLSEFAALAGLPAPIVLNRNPDDQIFSFWPTRSPYENTKNIYKALQSLAKTNLYHLTERVSISFENDDIFLGHPYFPHRPGKSGVTELAFQSKSKPQVLCLISPLHCDVTIQTSHINKDFLDDIDRLMPHADKLFAIMGPYWWDQWDKSPYAHWKPKMVRLDMAIDIQRFPRLKTTFNKPGKRGYLFIGGSWDPRKGSDYFSSLMSSLGNVVCGWIGDGPDIPGVRRISGIRELTPEFMSQIAKEYDFFVSPAKADPNPTTILECMAWGFPVVCTPQSGYYATPYRHNIYLDDLSSSVSVLQQLQYLDEDLLLNMANFARDVVASDYSWEILCNKIISEVSTLVNTQRQG